MSDTEKITDYTHYLVLPLKIVGCWEWYPKACKESHIIINDIYLCMVLFVLMNMPIALIVNLYTERSAVMESLGKIADMLPLIVAVLIVAYIAVYKNELYELVDSMNKEFVFYSAKGLTNMTMRQSYVKAMNFAYFYTVCTLFSVTMYVTLPIIVHLLTKLPIQQWVYSDVTRRPTFVFVFLFQSVGQAFVGLAVGQLGFFWARLFHRRFYPCQIDDKSESIHNKKFASSLSEIETSPNMAGSPYKDGIEDDEGNEQLCLRDYIGNKHELGVFFAVNSILICGQLDLLCCSLRNVRYTALLQCGVSHAALAAANNDILKDEQHNYVYNNAEMTESVFHFDRQMFLRLSDQRTQFDIYSTEFDEATSTALRDCARICRIINAYKYRFERFVSPLLVLRVVQVTMYLCTLLYSATLKFDTVTVEYLGAVALDMFVYCYFGNQIILQSDRVSTAAYQSAWHTMGVKPRRLLLNILLANKRSVVVRAGSFLPMDLHTFVVIIKTSFSYYTLLVNVNEKKH